ncbi:Starch-binding associating with outer membrane [Pustulibacterium marinum]|uniref:Starch-binding associating with outer membrane n=1 Tax=Pustulibacterium marinum TaxID=1224947 RepID=A0A1I7EUG9_9FLAO|nr:RagB/SusD family nutrient uptake outer membrane protein [Pustulibacterium marinum]SFU27539.1 Starch-binding associating with outer membrane [Pustulibacterium marinum]
MKKIYISLLAMSLAFTSCQDYLEEENLSNVTTEDFYTTATGYESLLNANYSQLRDIYGSEPWLFSAGTDMYAEGRNAEPVGLSQYTELNSSSDGVALLYDECYEAIQIANMAVYYSDLTEQTSELQSQLGQIKYLRANAFFLLVQTYGDVSLVTDYIQEPVLEFSRTPAEEVYSFIISELEEALTMVNDGAYDGHVNRRAVQHLLAKVYLTRGYESFGNNTDFSTAATYADAAIGGESLTIPFEELWMPDNGMNSETIFSVQYDDASVTADPTDLGNQQAYYFGSYLGGSEVAGDAPYRSYTLCPTSYAIDLFEQGDERWDATFMIEVFDRYFDYYDVEDHSTLEVTHYFEPKWYANNDTYMTDYIAAHPDVEYHEYGTYDASVNPNLDYETIIVKKFDDPDAPFSASSSTRDIILARLGETYLIAAEAYLQAGDEATGLARLNEVRQRAGVADATLAEFNLDYILDERGRELLGEYHRWFDLKRTGTLVERASMYHYLINENNFIGLNGNLKIVRPIPQTALDLNQNNDFEQNPAYE